MRADAMLLVFSSLSFWKGKPSHVMMLSSIWQVLLAFANQAQKKAEYKESLRRTAFATTKSFIRKAVEDMKRLCDLVDEAKGGYFKERA